MSYAATHDASPHLGKLLHILGIPRNSFPEPAQGPAKPSRSESSMNVSWSTLASHCQAMPVAAKPRHYRAPSSQKRKPLPRVLPTGLRQRWKPGAEYKPRGHHESSTSLPGTAPARCARASVSNAKHQSATLRSNLNAESFRAGP